MISRPSAQMLSTCLSMVLGDRSEATKRLSTRTAAALRGKSRQGDVSGLPRGVETDHEDARGAIGVSSLRLLFELGGAGTRMIPYGPRSRFPFRLSCSTQIAWFCADRRCHNGSRSGSDHRHFQRDRRIAVEAGSAARSEHDGDGGGRLSGRPARLDLHDSG